MHRVASKKDLRPSYKLSDIIYVDLHKIGPPGAIFQIYFFANSEINTQAVVTRDLEEWYIFHIIYYTDISSVFIRVSQFSEKSMYIIIVVKSKYSREKCIISLLPQD